MIRLTSLITIVNLMVAINTYGQYASPRDLFTKTSLSVPANMPVPVSTGVFVQTGDYVYIETKGRVTVGSWVGDVDATGKFSAVGSKYNKPAYKLPYHGALISLVGTNEFHPCVELFKWELPALPSNQGKIEVINGYMDYLYRGILQNYMVDPGRMVIDNYRNVRSYLPGTYFIAQTSGELKFDINDTDTVNNTGSFAVTIYTMKQHAHLNRNAFNRCPSQKPVGGRDCKGNTWSDEGNINPLYYHGINDSYRGTGSNAGCQCVYDCDNILIDHEHEGTFDIGFWLMKEGESSEARHLHLILDMLPHELYEQRKAHYQSNSTIVRCPVK